MGILKLNYSLGTIPSSPRSHRHLHAFTQGSPRVPQNNIVYCCCSPWLPPKGWRYVLHAGSQLCEIKADFSLTTGIAPSSTMDASQQGLSVPVTAILMQPCSVTQIYCINFCPQINHKWLLSPFMVDFRKLVSTSSFTASANDSQVISGSGTWRST